MAEVIKRDFPQAHVAMLIRRYTSELVEDNPFVDSILYYDEDNGVLTPFFELIQKVREQNFDVVIHTQPRPRLGFLTKLAQIPIRIGTGYRWYSFLFNRKVYDHRKDSKHHELEYNLRLLVPLGIAVDGLRIEPTLSIKQDILNSISNMLEKHGIGVEQKLVILHPGSGGSARDWSAQKFGDLAHRLGNISSVRVVITGKKDEEHLVNEIVSIAGSKVIPMIDIGGLREFAALSKSASLFVANSTGPIHIAAAVGTPVIGLYPQLTSQNEVRWGPYTKNKTVFTPKNKPVDCNVCQLQKTKICECMETISVEDVFQAALKHLQISM